MTLQEAKSIREKHKHIIGTSHEVSGGSAGIVSEILIIPMNQDIDWSNCIKNFRKGISNEKYFVKDAKDEYRVVGVIYNTMLGLGSVGKFDLGFMEHNSSKSKTNDTSNN